MARVPAYMIRSHVFRVHLKMVEFWTTGTYTDVTIECDDGTSYKCHRLALASASEYFHTMFSSNFQERTAEKVQLREMSSATIEQVLKFIYLGDVAISDGDDVVNLLQASELFQLSAIENVCVQFVEMNGLTVSHSWDVFAFARATNKMSLVDILSHRIATRFEVFSKDDRFLEVSFDDLSMILKRMSSSSIMRKDTSVLAAVARWIKHKGEGSQCYLDELIDLISFEEIPQTYLKPIFAKLLVTSTLPPKRFKGYGDVLELLQEGAIPTRPAEKSLHFFVSDAENRSMKLYSMNSSHICSLSAVISPQQIDQWVNAVVVDDYYFYCLNYVVGANENVSDRQTFHAYTSVKMGLQIKLKSPPVIFPFVQAVAQQNTIYFYNPTFGSQPVIRSNVPSSLNDGEIRRGIYAYNCEVDHWFAVPMMKIRVEQSSLATCNNNLYLIGGATLEDQRQSTIVQVYDSRAGNWEELPGTNYEHERAASYIMDGRIYVFGGAPDVRSAERFDLAAGKWENLAPMICGSNFVTSPMPSHYMEELWVKSNVMCFDVYNVQLNKWREVPIIAEENFDLCGLIMGAFVFKST